MQLQLEPLDRVARTFAVTERERERETEKESAFVFVGVCVRDCVYVFLCACVCACLPLNGGLCGGLLRSESLVLGETGWASCLRPPANRHTVGRSPSQHSDLRISGPSPRGPALQVQTVALMWLGESFSVFRDRFCWFSSDSSKLRESNLSNRCRKSSEGILHWVWSFFLIRYLFNVIIFV